VRDVLGLESWVKTTGRRGLHVVVPIRPSRDWSECLDFARNVSEAIERTDPIYTTTFAKAGRERKILTDYMRNNRTNTSVSAFSPRARPGALVSMPLEWRDPGGGPERVDAADRTGASQAPQERSVGRILEGQTGPTERVDQGTAAAVTEAFLYSR
jgi:DNA primase